MTCTADSPCADEYECLFGYCTPADTYLTCQSTECPDSLECFDSLCLPPPNLELAVLGNLLTHTFERPPVEGASHPIDRSGRGNSPVRSLISISADNPKRAPYAKFFASNTPDNRPRLQWPDNPSFSFATPKTIEFWLQPFTARKFLGDRLDNESSPPEFSIEQDDVGLLHFYTNGGCESPTEIDLVGPVLDDGFVHIAYTWDGEFIRLYLNAELFQEYPLAATPCPHVANLRAGPSIDDIHDVLDLDELKISDYAKSPAELGASSASDLSPLLATCGDRLHYPGEECDSELCCDPQTCRFRPEGTACADTGQCQRGVCIGEATRVEDGLVLDYRFDEGLGDRVADATGQGPDLLIQDPAAVIWETGSLRVEGETVLESVAPPTSMLTACTQENAVSIELWVTPSRDDYPARANIASFSRSVISTNFMVGQLGDRFVGRVRFPSIYEAGHPELLPEAMTTTISEQAHVVLTHNQRGERYLYINGRRAQFNRGLPGFESWAASFLLRLGSEWNKAEDTRVNFWLGTYHRFSVYCRALNSQEVSRNYAAGAESS